MSARAPEAGRRRAPRAARPGRRARAAHGSRTAQARTASGRPRAARRAVAPSRSYYTPAGLPDGSNAQEDKRRLLLDAAVKVFARKGYHASRVGDIAEEAGVAYGLLYHYFPSKEDVLRTVFRETWRALIETIQSVEEAGDPPREQLRKVAEILLRSWRRDPDLVRVLVLEVTRSQHLPGEMEEIGESFAAIQEIVERGQADGSIRPDLDAL